jgi:hypothetical protein
MRPAKAVRRRVAPFAVERRYLGSRRETSPPARLLEACAAAPVSARPLADEIETKLLKRPLRFPSDWWSAA